MATDRTRLGVAMDRYHLGKIKKALLLRVARLFLCAIARVPKGVFSLFSWQPCSLILEPPPHQSWLGGGCASVGAERVMRSLPTLHDNSK